TGCGSASVSTRRVTSRGSCASSKAISRVNSTTRTCPISRCSPTPLRHPSPRKRSADSMNTAYPATTHLLLIPSYNPGPKVYQTVHDARQQWMPVWVVVDGSTAGTAEGLQALAESDPGLRVIVLPRNVGKGAAVL